MSALVTLFYNGVVLPTLALVFWIGALVNKKLAKRREAAQSISSIITQCTHGLQPSMDNQTIWFHAASMGEFEQLRPVISRIHTVLPNACCIVSLFSVSGLAAARTLEGVTHAFILPLDTSWGMRKLVTAIRPSLVVFNRYDVWPNMIRALHRIGIPTALVNATAPTAGQNPLLRSWIANTYRYVTTIIAITEAESSTLKELVEPYSSSLTITVIPDTRVDAVVDRIRKPHNAITQYRDENVRTIVAGSSWSEDEELLAEAMELINSAPRSNHSINQPLRLIIVPHEPTPPAIHRIQSRFDCTVFSRSEPGTRGNIVVDSIGKLLNLYSIADAAFVGGGFGSGVHSVTEPAVYGMPIVCGPGIMRSDDALRFTSSGILTIVNSAQELATWISTVVLDSHVCAEVSERSRQVATQGAGSASDVARMLLSMVNHSNAQS